MIPASDTEDTQLVEEHAFSMAMPLEDEGDEREPDPPTKLSEESKSPAEPTPAEVGGFGGVGGRHGQAVLSSSNHHRSFVGEKQNNHLCRHNFNIQFLQSSIGATES